MRALVEELVVLGWNKSDIIHRVVSINTRMEYIGAGTYLGVASGIVEATSPHRVIGKDGRIDIHYDFLHIITVHITTSIQY